MKTPSLTSTASSNILQQTQDLLGVECSQLCGLVQYKQHRVGLQAVQQLCCSLPIRRL